MTGEFEPQCHSGHSMMACSVVAVGDSAAGSTQAASAATAARPARPAKLEEESEVERVIAPDRDRSAPGVTRFFQIGARGAAAWSERSVHPGLGYRAGASLLAQASMLSSDSSASRGAVLST